jgi:hypothetical protein
MVTEALMPAAKTLGDCATALTARYTKTVQSTKAQAQKALRDLLHAADTGNHVCRGQNDTGTVDRTLAFDRLPR